MLAFGAHSIAPDRTSSSSRTPPDAAQVLSIMLLTIVFGLLLDRFLFGLIEQRIRKLWGLVVT